MYNAKLPSQEDLPSTRKLLRSTILAAIAAAVLLVTIVLPAEYGIDPTGIGGVLGLQRMGEIKAGLAKEAEAGRAAQIAAMSESASPKTEEAMPLPTGEASNHEMTFTLAPDESTEIKLKMSQGSKADFVWWTDGQPANFDLHGDSKAVNYFSYGKGIESRSEGVLEAAFDGSHGWYWRNRTGEPMTITLQTDGVYIEIKQLD